MTDEQHRAEHKALTLDLLGLAAVGLPDAVGQASALLAAATVLIERELGTAMAPAALSALIEPTMAAWQAQRQGSTAR